MLQVYIFHVRRNSNIIKYTIVSANTFKRFWLHASTAMRPSSSQHIQIKCLQCAYNMGSHSVYNCNVYNNHYCNVNIWIKYDTVWLDLNIGIKIKWKATIPARMQSARWRVTFHFIFIPIFKCNQTVSYFIHIFKI